EREALYVPLVWHSAQRALRIGRMSWAKSTAFVSARAAAGSANTQASRPRTRRAGRGSRGRVILAPRTNGSVGAAHSQTVVGSTSSPSRSKSWVRIPSPTACGDVRIGILTHVRVDRRDEPG